MNFSFAEFRMRVLGGLHMVVAATTTFPLFHFAHGFDETTDRRKCSTLGGRPTFLFPFTWLGNGIPSPSLGVFVAGVGSICLGITIETEWNDNDDAMYIHNMNDGRFITGNVFECVPRYFFFAGKKAQHRFHATAWRCGVCVCIQTPKAEALTLSFRIDLTRRLPDDVKNSRSISRPFIQLRFGESQCHCHTLA